MIKSFNKFFESVNDKKWISYLKDNLIDFKEDKLNDADELFDMIQLSSSVPFDSVHKIVADYVNDNITLDECIKKLTDGDRKQQKKMFKQYVNEFIYDDADELYDTLNWIARCDIFKYIHPIIKKKNNNVSDDIIQKDIDNLMKKLF